MDEFYIDQTLYHGRPASAANRLPKEMACYDLLDRLEIPYARADHSHADTIAQCEAVEQVLGEKICKNLFLCNRQKRPRTCPSSWAWPGSALPGRRTWSGI